MALMRVSLLSMFCLIEVVWGIWLMFLSSSYKGIKLRLVETACNVAREKRGVFKTEGRDCLSNFPSQHQVLLSLVRLRGTGKTNRFQQCRIRTTSKSIRLELRINCTCVVDCGAQRLR
eukprot:Blabericola_migrator_1__5448@NODE_2785_length_2354_cov_991_862702_g1746_i0_p5_GENE_NODE_2785_length_2354_cov_991_862702_g1746_i0NODE_2785_length_2354_cov_991_862702_g1746_i0_p5_ORF_typecomplete_len118_score13_63_NODE_2785_length_2354_cov_991_862702_g1746_i0501854